jgi:hypothetical protein
MWYPNFHEIVGRLAHIGDYLPAILVTAAVALLIGCALGCTNSPCKEKDDLFHREVF